MTIGTSIFVIALGAILAFAVRQDLGWLDVQVAGGVLILTGLTMLAITVAMWSRRRRRVTVAEETTPNLHPPANQDPLRRSPTDESWTD